MKKTIKKQFLASLFLVGLVAPGAGQVPKEKGHSFSLGEFQKDKAFTPLVGVQSWVTYSMHEVRNDEEYANRFNASFRRLRFGAKGSPYKWLSYEFELSLDRLGEDNYAAIKGSYKGLEVWKAYLTAKLSKNDLVHLHAGYYWAAISRDFNTSSWTVSSFDKTAADGFLRNFLTGKINGIESGLGFGGLKNWNGFGLSYRIGAYSPAAYAGKQHFNPLLTGRLILSIGDPEQATYNYMLCGNHWNKRNGLSIGFGGARQGSVDTGTVFDCSKAYGADLMASLGGFKLEGEYYKMKRELGGSAGFDGTEWFVRCGYNFRFKTTLVEPTLTYDYYEGDGDKALFNYIGNDETFDVGINWHLNKDKLKIALHYLNQQGSASSCLGDLIGMSLQMRL